MSGFDWVRNTEQAHIRLGDQYRWYALRLTAQRLTNALKTDRDGNYHWDEQYQLPDLYSFRSAEREFRKSTQFYSDALLNKLGKAFSALVKEASKTVQKTVQAAALKEEEDLTPIRFDPASASLLVAVRDTINTVFPMIMRTMFQASHGQWEKSRVRPNCLCIGLGAQVKQRHPATIGDPCEQGVRVSQFLC